MIFDAQIIQTIAVVGAIVAYFGYQFFGKGASKAKDETADTYKDLNEALEKRMVSMETEQKVDRAKIIDLEEKISRLITEKLSVDNLVVRALREFFASNPKVASNLQEQFKIK